MIGEPIWDWRGQRAQNDLWRTDRRYRGNRRRVRYRDGWNGKRGGGAGGDAIDLNEDTDN
jgi:hypothetical protein